MSDKNNFGSFFMGLTVGALAGAIASLLLAPQSGEETRQVIKEKAIELKEKGAETYEETKHKAEIAYKDALAKADDLAKVTKEKAAEFSHQAKVKIDKIVEQHTPDPAEPAESTEK